MDYIPKIIQIYLTIFTMESFQAKKKKSKQPKLIKLFTSFLQSMLFCAALCWFQCLSDPAPSWFQCAQLAEKYPGEKKKKKANNFLLSSQTETAQYRIRYLPELTQKRGQQGSRTTAAPAVISISPTQN